MTFNLARVTTSYNPAGTRIINLKEEVIGSFDTAGFALAAEQLARSTYRSTPSYAQDERTNTITAFYARHASGQSMNVVEFMWREMMDDATIDRVFPPITISF